MRPTQAEAIRQIDTIARRVEHLRGTLKELAREAEEIYRALEALSNRMGQDE
jgi:prefoldin subunit 5